MPRLRKRSFLWTTVSFLASLLVGFQIGRSGLTARFTLTRCRPASGRHDAGSAQEILHKRSLPDARELVLIGVMTSRQYLETRARTIHRTWGQDHRLKVIFFVGEGRKVDTNLPVEVLSNVKDDGYPPQKKSFAMLAYLYEAYGDRFHWFARLDDDVFLRPGKLTSLLASVNASRPFYVGQPGYGRNPERGKLGLPRHIPYCMGGTGVFLSRGALATLTPKLSTCLNNTVTSHEDTELGRCVLAFVGLTCTRSLLFTKMFYSIYDGKLNMRNREVVDALSIHPVKNQEEMVQLHTESLVLKVKALSDREEHLGREASLTATHAASGNSGRTGQSTSGISGSLLARDAALSHVESWDQFKRKQLFSLHNIYSIPVVVAKRTSPKLAKIQQALSALAPRLDPLPLPDLVYRGYSASGGLYHRFFIRKEGNSTLNFGTAERFRRLSIVEDETPVSKRVHVVVPVHRRSRTFESYLAILEGTLSPQVGLLAGTVRVRIVIFADAEKDHDISHELCRTLASNKTLPFELECMLLDGEFSRARAFQIGVFNLKPDDLILLSDIDIVFTRAFVLRVATNVIKGKQLYFPICFSQFDPHLLCGGHGDCEIPPFNISADTGLWRSFGFGVVAFYKEDFTKVGGFNTMIKGWGKEDVEFFDRCLKNNYRTFRAPDPELVHLYHPKECDKNLTRQQWDMCESSRLAMTGSYKTMADILFKAALIK